MIKVTSKEYFKENPEALRREDNIIKTLAIIYTGTMKEIEETYGPEAVEIARRGFLKAKLGPDKEAFAQIKDKSVLSYCTWLNSILHLTHEFEMTYDEQTESAQYDIRHCPWAEHFRNLGGEKYGIFFCDADCPMAEAFDERLGFERTKILMDGDECCNHRYFKK